MSADVALRVDAEAIAACDPGDERVRRLYRLIDQDSLLRGNFTLSSGRKSNYLFQLRQTTLDPEGAALIGDLIVEFMRLQHVRCIGGLELGAVPVVTAVATMSFQRTYPISAFFVRKQAKAHGARERIDGQIPDSGEVLVVDDVTTTGQSILDAVKHISNRKLSISKALSIVDREEGAAEKLASHGITLFSLFKRSQFDIG